MIIKLETLGLSHVNNTQGTYTVADMDQHVSVMNHLFGLHPHTIASCPPLLQVLKAHSEEAFALLESLGSEDAEDVDTPVAADVAEVNDEEAHESSEEAEGVTDDGVDSDI